LRKVSLVACAAIAIVAPNVVVMVNVAAAPAPAAAASPKPVAPRLTDIALGGGARVAAAGPLTVSRPVTPGFSAVGVSWAPDRAVGDVDVTFRTRVGTGAWTAWNSAGTDDEAPDPADLAARAGTRGGTEPVWTGPATGVEATINVISGAAPRDLRLTLVDPGTSAADGAVAPTATTTAAGKPAILSRAQWGADPALMGWDPEYAPSIRAGFLHHTAGTNSYAAADVPAILRSIYVFHSQTRGWGDIGYNFLVDRFGRTWEGRYGGVDSTVIGAHTGGFNTGTFGVAMMGNFDTVAVPAATRAAVEAVFAWKFARWKVNPTGTVRLTSAGGGTSKYPAGAVVTKNTLSGHRDVGNTECPGTNGYALLPAIRTRVKALIGATPTLVSPVISPSSVPYGAATGPRITSGLSGSSSWTVVVTRDCPAGAVKTWSGTGTTVETRWDLRDSAARVVRPGSYTVTLYPGATGTGAAYSAHVTVAPQTAAPPPATGAMPAAGPAGYVPVAPTRILDSRGSLPVGGAARRDVVVLGVGGVPAAGVSAVLLSATGICATAASPLTLWPAGTARPGTTSVSLPAGAAESSLVAVRVGAGGRVSVAGGAAASADAVLDVVGYLPTNAGAGLHLVPGTRVLDTTVAAGATRALTLPAGTVPATATAVLANLAAVSPAGSGDVRAWPAGGSRPAVAHLLYKAGVTSSDRVVVGVSGGRLQLLNNGASAVRIAVDVTGWYGGTGARFTAVAPARVAAPAVGAGATVAVPVPGRPAGATAVLISLSARPSAHNYLTAWGSGARPPTADLHAEAGVWETTTAVLPVGADGKVRLYSANSAAKVVLDVVGWYR
jgi:N-acetylmuramoyl-L-alanine amidase